MSESKTKLLADIDACAAELNAIDSGDSALATVRGKLFSKLFWLNYALSIHNLIPEEEVK